MTIIHTLRREDGFSVWANGHAEYAKAGDDDIVCAGISALLFSVLSYLECLSEKTGIGDLKYGWHEGDLIYHTEGFGGQDFFALDLLETGLKMLAERYPAHVKVNTHTDGISLDDLLQEEDAHG